MNRDKRTGEEENLDEKIIDEVEEAGESEEFDFEPEDEMGSVGAAKAKMRKLRDELEAEKAKSKEYLDGWQRCKADLANFRRDASENVARAGDRAREELIADIVPVLDSFDMAASTEAWENMDPNWRHGIDSIRNQLLDVLERNGVKRFGKVGDIFDPRLHEAVQEMSDVAGEPHSIVRLLRSGYKMGERVVRPAQVILKAA